jgi:riboflavin kinase/FMN adenylyltransferase
MLSEYHSFSSLHLEKTCVTIGAFDGIHLGHRSLLDPFIDYAERLHLPTAVVTFDPPPTVFFQRNGIQKNIILPEERASILSPLGIQYLITLKFDQKLADLSPHEFISEMKHALNMESIWVGMNFSLGKNRSGTTDVIRGLMQEFNFSLYEVPQLTLDGDVVSSTRIRGLLTTGNIREANHLLGYSFFINNEIIHGEARGRKLGIPTINMAYPEKKVMVAKGVYATRITIQDDIYAAVTNVGTRPTFHDEEEQVVIESFLLENAFDDLYGKTARIEFVEYLRTEKKFPSAKDLVDQIHQDIAEAREILS